MKTSELLSDAHMNVLSTIASMMSTTVYEPITAVIDLIDDFFSYMREVVPFETDNVKLSSYRSLVEVAATIRSILVSEQVKRDTECERYRNEILNIITQVYK